MRVFGGMCKWIVGEAYSKFGYADPVKFREFVISRRLDYEEGCGVLLESFLKTKPLVPHRMREGFLINIY